MKLNQLLSVIIAIYTSFPANAQDFQWGRYHNGEFNNIGPASVSDVTSDFGMRNAGTGASRFHRGVDISPVGDQDVVLVAPFDGIIEEIIAPAGNIKYIIDIMYF